MTNLITRTNGEPFATESNAKGARTRMGLNDTHDVIQHGGGWVLSEMQGEQDQGDAAVTLQPGDYIATKGLTEDEYHAVARAFMAAGAEENEYDKDDDMPDFWALFGWGGCNGLAHWEVAESFGGDTRQLTLSQVLGATNAGAATQPEEPTTEQQHMPQQHLADQLEAALMALEHAQSEVDRLQAEYRAAYPKIHGEVVLSEDMTDPANWRAGDVVECIDSDFKWVRESGVSLGQEVTLDEDIDRSELEQGGVAVIARGYKYHMEHQAFRFVHRP